MAKSATSSSWTALRNPIFRAIWFASVISGTCASAHGTAATWAMNELSPSALLLSMMSTFTSLPFFLFTLPAGAVADMVDRRKLVAVMHIWLAAAAGGLAILGWLHLLNGNLILLFVFLLGTGFAFNAPAFCTIACLRSQTSFPFSKHANPRGDAAPPGIAPWDEIKSANPFLRNELQLSIKKWPERKISK